MYQVAKRIRRHIIDMANSSKSAHVASCLSCVDILTQLYFKELNLEPWSERDIFILSKGHGAMALYSTLAVKGIIDEQLLSGYSLNNGTLPAHLDLFSSVGVEASSGALGHGFNIGLGMALGFKRKGLKRKVYTVIGDGESQEGSIWEGAMFAPKLKIDNFTAIVDYNKLQGYGRPQELCTFEPFKQKWEAFGWCALEVDGHDFSALQQAFDVDSKGLPKVIIAHTIKGRGVSFMEDELKWHYFIVTDEHKQQALKELQ